MLGTCAILFNVKLFVLMTQFEKLGEQLDILWTNTFFFYNKTNWLLLKLLCSGYLFWLEELFESWIFLQCSPCCFCTAYVATPARSHGNSYIFYTVANLYEFVWTHSYKFIRFLLNLTYFTSCQFVGICTNDLHLTPPLSLPVTWV